MKTDVSASFLIVQRCYRVINDTKLKSLADPTTSSPILQSKILFDKLDVPHEFNFMPLFLKKVIDCNIGEEVVGSFFYDSKASSYDQQIIHLSPVYH